MTGSFEEGFESEFFGEGISAEYVLFVERIEDEGFSGLDMFLERLESGVGFGFERIGCSEMGAQGRVVPLGIEECLAGQGHSAHGARWVVVSSTAARDGQSHVHGDIGAD